MARIGSYPIDAVIQDKDAWIGTQNTNRVTRQFTALGVAEYIDTKNVGLVFVGATNLLSGAKGLVPAPVAGQEGMYLKGNLGGGWTTIPIYTLDVPTGTTNVNLINTDGAGGIINSFITLTGGTYLTSVHTSGTQITFNHDLTTRTDTASASSPAAGGTVDIVSSVTSNATGHIEAVNIETVTWPADSDTTYTIDIPNNTTNINLAGSDGTNDPIAFTTTGVNNGMTLTRTDASNLNFSSIWQQNTRLVEGYVPKGEANASKFWATDAAGNPGWTFQPSQDQTLTSTGTSNASTGVILSQNGGTVIIKGDGSTISASSDNTTNVITLEAINRVNTTYTLPIGAVVVGDNLAKIELTDNAAIVSTVTINGTANKIAISEIAGNNGEITIGMPDDVTVAGELTVSGAGQSSFTGQLTIPQTPSADTDAASKKYVDDLVAGGLTFRGTFRADTGEILSGVSVGSFLYNCPGGAGTRIAVAVGDYYIVATAAGSFYCSGVTLDIGDSIIATAAAAADASVVSEWSVVQSDEGVASFTNTNGTFISAGTVNNAATGAVTMGAIDLSAGGTASATTFLRGDNTWAVPAYVSYSAMTTSTLGLGKIKYDFGSTPAAESQSTTTARTYGVTKNASDQLVVNVPWLNSSDVNSVTASGATTALSGLSSTPNTGAVVIGLDINGRASLGSPAADDELMIYDTSTAKNVKVLVSDLASYAGSAVANQVTYWTSANEIGGATGFTYAGGATGAITMGGALGVDGIITANSSSTDDYVRIYGSSGTGKWDIYGNGANLRISDNESAGILAVDTGATFGGVLTVSGDTGGVDSIARFQNTNSTAKSTRIQLLDSAGTVGDALIAYDHSNASSALHYLGMGVNNSTTLVISNSDNVGIGITPNNGYKLDVFDATEALFRVRTSNAAGNGGVYIGNGDKNWSMLVRHSQTEAYEIRDETENATRFAIDGSGNAMIGGTTTFNGVTGETGFEIYGNTAQLLINNPTYNHFTIYSASDSNIYNVFGSSGDYLIGTGNKNTSSWLEKMRINSFGQTWLGGTFTGANIANTNASYLNNLNAGGFSILHRNAADVYIHFNTYYNSSNVYEAKYGGAQGFRIDSGAVANGLGFYKAPVVTNAGDTQAFSYVMRIGYGADNNVGIGMEDPGAKLDVLQEARVSYANSNQYTLRITNTDGNPRILADGSAAALIFGTTPGGSATATERMRIESGGDITVSGGDLFLNSGTNYNDKGVVYFSNERTAIISDIVNGTANGDTSLDFQTRKGGTRASAMFINEFRNVMIGTTTQAPSAQLTIAINDSVGGRLSLSNLRTALFDGDEFGRLSFVSNDETQTGDRARISALCRNTGAATDLVFYTGNTSASIGERMRITSAGNVNITNTGAAIINLQAGTNQSASLRLKNDVSDWDVNCQTNDNFAIFDHTAGLERLTISTTGALKVLGLKGYTPTGSDVRYDTGDGEIYYQTSSKRYKTDIVNLESSLDKINKLRPVRYKDINTKQPACGLIAEETFKVIPDVVFNKKIEGFDEPQIEGLNYSDLVPFLIKAIQELKAEIEILKNK